MLQTVKYLWLLGALLLSLPFAKAGDAPKGGVYDPTPTVMHHISDAHHFNLIGDTYLPLPCIALVDGKVFFTLSSAFGPFANHGNGSKAVNGFVIYQDQLMRVKDSSFPKETVDLDQSATGDHHQTVSSEGLKGKEDGKKKAIYYQGKAYELEAASSLQHLSTWYDFSITKNVFSMILGFLLLFIIFRTVASAYKKRQGQAPKGVQSLMEIVILFLRDQVFKPSLGKQTDRFAPFLFSLFFFILINNLLGLIPFFPGSANVTGNIGATLVLAAITFLVVNLNGNKHYWEHVFWMPGVPALIKLILTPIEVLGLFIKPITLLIRLFANIAAGHIIILSLVSLIFVFNSSGQLGGGPGGVVLAVPFVFALNLMELFVAFLQAYVFTLLATLYIGSAIEEHHHDHEHDHAHEGHH
jgi:F-type H+-transporting ATPase subunit a